jgi:hypothetical protein
VSCGLHLDHQPAPVIIVIIIMIFFFIIITIACHHCHRFHRCHQNDHLYLLTLFQPHRSLARPKARSAHRCRPLYGFQVISPPPSPPLPLSPAFAPPPTITPDLNCTTAVAFICITQLIALAVPTLATPWLTCKSFFITTRNTRASAPLPRRCTLHRHLRTSLLQT